MAAPTLAALRAVLTQAEARCALAYHRWREAHLAVQLARKALRQAEKQATPQEARCSN